MYSSRRVVESIGQLHAPSVLPVYPRGRLGTGEETSCFCGEINFFLPFLIFSSTSLLVFLFLVFTFWNASCP